jgi:uncharacterized repeat protein (TIGR01451 family)
MLPTMAHAVGTAPGLNNISNVARIQWKVNTTDFDSATLATETSVRAVSSDTMTDVADVGFGVGETATFVYTFTNTGNRADTFNIWISDSVQAGGASGWVVSLYIDGAYQTVLQNDTKVSASVNADGTSTCSVAIWSNPANAPNNSYCTFTLRIMSGNVTNADTWIEYRGDNDSYYALGGAGSFDTAAATIAAPYITLAKTITSVTISGAATHPLPGASILYNLGVNNSGNAAASNVIVRDTIPENTTFDTAQWRPGMDAPFDQTDSALFDATDSSAGWLCQYSTVATPDHSFGNTTEWSALSTLAYTSRATVKHVRWVRTTLPQTDGLKTMRFRVVIR